MAKAKKTKPADEEPIYGWEAMAAHLVQQGYEQYQDNKGAERLRQQHRSIAAPFIEAGSAGCYSGWVRWSMPSSLDGLPAASDAQTRESRRKAGRNGAAARWPRRTDPSSGSIW